MNCWILLLLLLGGGKHSGMCDSCHDHCMDDCMNNRTDNRMDDCGCEGNNSRNERNRDWERENRKHWDNNNESCQVNDRDNVWTPYMNNSRRDNRDNDDCGCDK